MDDARSQEDIGERSRSSPLVQQALSPGPPPASEGRRLKTVGCRWRYWRSPCYLCLPEVARAVNGGTEGLLVGDRVPINSRRGKAQNSRENKWLLVWTTRLTPPFSERGPVRQVLSGQLYHRKWQ